MGTTSQKTDKDTGVRIHCTAFCPTCGSDLYYVDQECICKKRGCHWHCGGCKDQ